MFTDCCWSDGVSDKDVLLMFTLMFVPQGGPPRTSSLLGPIMQLSGHQGDVLCGKFHPEGEVLASAGMDRQICEEGRWCSVCCCSSVHNKDNNTWSS